MGRKLKKLKGYVCRIPKGPPICNSREVKPSDEGFRIYYQSNLKEVNMKKLSRAQICLFDVYNDIWKPFRQSFPQ